MRDRADPRLVLADRVEQLYGQMWLGHRRARSRSARSPPSSSGSSGCRSWCSSGGAWCCSSPPPAPACSTPTAAAPDKVANAAQWLRWLGIAALATGANWGFAGAVFFPSHTDEQQVFLAFLLAGMMSGGIPVYAASWPIYALYAAGIVAPFTYVLATFGNRLFTEIALLVPMFYAINVAIAYRLTQVFHSGYRLRHAYGRLTEDYSVLNQRLERQLVELEEARRQVEASGRKLALFAERAPIAVLELDAGGAHHAGQPRGGAAVRLYRRASWSARPVNTPGAAGVPRGVRRATGTRLMAPREPMAGLKIRNPRRDGLEVICEWTVTPLVNPEGTIIAVIAQGRDVTAQLEAERVKKEFTSTLSHELRTPLTSIIGSLQLVNSGVLGDLRQDVAELTQVAERNGQRLLDLINDILDIEKIESGKLTLVPEVLRVDELVREAMVLNKAFGERFKVRFETPGRAARPAEVHADRKRLLQVMTNLLSNAAKFSPEGGAVEVGHRGRRAQRARRGARPRARHPGGVPQPHLRPLRAGRLDRHPAEGRHRPGPRRSASAWSR